MYCCVNSPLFCGICAYICPRNSFLFRKYVSSHTSLFAIPKPCTLKTTFPRKNGTDSKIGTKQKRCLKKNGTKQKKNGTKQKMVSLQFFHATEIIYFHMRCVCLRSVKTTWKENNVFWLLFPLDAFLRATDFEVQMYFYFFIFLLEKFTRKVCLDRKVLKKVDYFWKEKNLCPKYCFHGERKMKKNLFLIIWLTMYTIHTDNKISVPKRKISMFWFGTSFPPGCFCFMKLWCGYFFF